MTEKKVLIEAYEVAKNLDFNTIPDIVKRDIDILVDKIDKNKSIICAVVTSLLKKIENPNQDVRLHRTDFENGYSARTLDTQVTIPFFKEYFPRYANKESAFLTLATRERIKWTKSEGQNLKIRDKELKNSFLNIFEQIQEEQVDPKNYLYYLFAKLLKISKRNQKILTNSMIQSKNLEIVTIDVLIGMLQEHFNYNEKGSSRLPVISIYTIYQMLLPKFERYKKQKITSVAITYLV
ncbi:MAG: DNA methyltransferase [Bacteroidia bacterium]|nr:DNA methyltransferase [Bacteroidia bacterium]MDW8345562.1 DNA methyltransferase [Bacteroidia bacterium]